MMSGQQEQMQRALEWSNNPELSRVFNAASQDRDLWAQAHEDPAEFLRSQGVELPKDLFIQFIGDPYMPVPDFEFFTIHMFNCRRMWVKKKDDVGYEEVEVCFGFEIVTHPIPGGPIG
jgi:hypothetical protein